MTHTSGKAPMIDSLAETAGSFDDEFHNNEHNNEEAYGGDVMGLKGGANQWTCWVCNEHGHSAKYCPYGEQKGKGKGGGSQKGKGNAKGTNFNVKGKGKINNAKGSGLSAEGQQWEESNGDHGTHGAKEAEKEAK